MPRQTMADVTKSLNDLVKEKQAVDAKTKTLLGELGTALRGIGYRLVPIRSASPSLRGMQSEVAFDGGTPRRTRRRMSAAARQAVSRRMKAYWAKRRAAKGKTGTKSK